MKLTKIAERLVTEMRAEIAKGWAIAGESISTQGVTVKVVGKRSITWGPSVLFLEITDKDGWTRTVKA